MTAAAEYRWNLDPVVIAWLLAAGGAYAWRLRKLRLRGRPASGAGTAARAGAFFAGLLVVGAALVSPIDSLGEERLFSMHMVQHLLLADIAPILLLLGLSRSFMRPAVRRLRPIEQALGPLAHPASAVVLLVGSMWAWHIPAMYELALDNPWAHVLEHSCFFATGIAFWWFVIEPVPPRHRLRGAWSLAYMSAAKVLMGLLGVLLTFSPSAIYDNYERAPRTWGMSALEDLNVGGVVMMLEQSIVLLIFFALLFTRMLAASERAEQRRERLETLS